MAQIERNLNLADTARDERVYSGMRSWVSDHVDDVIGILDYDPNNSDQWVERALLPAQPDIEKARLFGAMGMGPENYNALIRDFKRVGAVDIVRDNASAKVPKSTLFATLHIKDTLDTAMTHNALFAAADGEPAFAEKNAVLANYIMMAMTLGGHAVDRVLTKSGIEIRVLPDKALQYISKKDFDFINSVALRAFNALLKEGVAIHQAPSGTRALNAENILTGEEAKVVPIVAEGAANTIRKKSPEVIGVPTIVNFGDTKAAVLEPRRITSTEDVHRLMHEMVEEVNVFSDQLVFYGLPRGYRILKKEDSAS